jgi:hypothetical protein
MRLLLAVAAVAALVGGAGPGTGAAAVETLVFKTGPIQIRPYFTAQGEARAPSPKVDGYVIGMKADLVDAEGNALSYRDVMLHHVVFVNVFHRDATCSSFRDYDGQSLPFAPERFFGVGEEGAVLDLPEGYGYANKGSDVWGLVYMLMNHHATAQTAFIRYTVTYATGTSLVPVRPVWLDVENCRADPIWDVPGTGGTGSTATRSAVWTIPWSGRFVEGGAHLHGGGVQLAVSNQTCREPLFTSRPTWHRVEPTPLLHEGGPSHMSSFRATAGIPFSAGDRLRIAATYDDSLPHTRVMGIMLLYATQGEEASPCAPPPPLDVDLGSPGPPPLVRLPLAALPTGPVRSLATTWVGDYGFGAPRVTVAKGTRFTWRFVGSDAHNVTLFNGPVGFSSPNVRRGTWSHWFTRSGTYELVCALHPVAMRQIVTVK